MRACVRECAGVRGCALLWLYQRCAMIDWQYSCATRWRLSPEIARLRQHERHRSVRPSTRDMPTLSVHSDRISTAHCSYLSLCAHFLPQASLLAMRA